MGGTERGAPMGGGGTRVAPNAVVAHASNRIKPTRFKQGVWNIHIGTNQMSWHEAP